MTTDPSAFSFDIDKLNLDAKRDFITHVPSGLTDRGMLFDALQRALSLPGYFGRNWDALADCLRDLSWIDRRRVAILHDDLPRLDAKGVATYLDILRECVRDWKPADDHELVVAFPSKDRGAITRILDMRQIMIGSSGESVGEMGLRSSPGHVLDAASKTGQITVAARSSYVRIGRIIAATITLLTLLRNYFSASK